MEPVLIRLTKQLLVLYEHELIGLLARDPALHAKAIRRGKFYRRAEALERREASGRQRQRQEARSERNSRPG